MLEDVELELRPESGTGDDWSSLRKSKPPDGRRRQWTEWARVPTSLTRGLEENTHLCDVKEHLIWATVRSHQYRSFFFAYGLRCTAV